MGAHFQPAPPAAISRVLASFDRDQLAGFIAVAIDLLDLADGDPDAEENGDELDGSTAEDDWHPYPSGEAGCAISDPGEDDDNDTGVEDDRQGFDPEEDCCEAGDDRVVSGRAPGRACFDPRADLLGSEDDAEEDAPAPLGATKSREAHCRRVRLTRCRPFYDRWQRIEGYTFRVEPTVPSLRAMTARIARRRAKLLHRPH